MDNKALDTLQKVADVAALAGIRGKVDQERGQFVAGFELPEGRSQMVYVRPSREDVEDSTVITIFSPCHVFKKGFLRGITKEQCIELLMMNEQLTFARFGMWESQEEHMIVSSVDSILETLDPPELRAAMWHVAIAADSYERKYGSSDDF